MRRLSFLFAIALSACVAPVSAPPDGDVGALSSSLSAAARRTRAGQIRDAAARQGLEQGWLLAGIADAETTMAHCHSELTWACRGPASADCGGGPVVAGAGDGPCSLRQGGLGMFQFDAGTYEQTIARDGARVLSIAGNVEAAIDFTTSMVVRSAYIAGVDNRAQAIAWMNGVRIGNGRWDAWIRTVTHYYNGCAPSYSCFPSRYGRYRDHTQNIFHELGADFWNVSRCEAACVSDSQIRGADCGVGDCAAFGARCVDDALGVRCVSVFCSARGDDAACLPDGDTLVTCRDGGFVGTGRCSTFGARCVDDALGARCASVFCPDRGRTQACLPDGDTLITCQDGAVPSSGRCSAFGATCVSDELGARCVSVFCEPRGMHTACLPDGTLITCDDGGIAASVDCEAEGAACVDDELGARCVSELCEPTGTEDRCANDTMLVSCDDGAITGTIDCSDEGGQCADDGLGVRCVVCPEGEASSRCVDAQFLEVCSGGRATVTECTGGEVCSEEGDLARCVVPEAPVEPVEPIDPVDPVDPTDPTDPTDRPSGMLSGDCAAAPGASSPLAGFALLLASALALGRRRRSATSRLAPG